MGLFALILLSFNSKGGNKCELRFHFPNIFFCFCQHGIVSFPQKNIDNQYSKIQFSYITNIFNAYFFRVVWYTKEFQPVFVECNAMSSRQVALYLLNKRRFLMQLIFFIFKSMVILDITVPAINLVFRQTRPHNWTMQKLVHAANPKIF